MDKKEERAELHQLAHDLRNALGAIYMYAQILELSLQSEELKVAQGISASVKKMNAMITERIDSLER